MLIGDSAFPPATYPTTFQGKPVEGWCIYIGGDAYHVWTDQEIRDLLAQPWCRYPLPVFVRDNPQGAEQAAQDAAACAAWAAKWGQPRGTLTMHDDETAIDSPYEIAFDQGLRADDGDLLITYGSKSTVIQIAQPSGGYDEADWTGADQAPASMAVQFYSGPDFDMNEFRADAPLWDLRAATTPAAQPAARPLEDDMRTTSVSGRAGLAWPAGQCHVVEVNYANADQPDLVLNVELKLTTGPVYPGELTVSHLTGTGTYEIPAAHIAACRGVILTVASGPKNVVFDTCAA